MVRTVSSGAKGTALLGAVTNLVLAVVLVLASGEAGGVGAASDGSEDIRSLLPDVSGSSGVASGKSVKGVTVHPTRDSIPSLQEPTSPLTQEIFYSQADACVMQAYPTANFGSTLDMWAGYDDSPETMAEIVRSLVRFDISSLPAGADIDKATLRLYMRESWDYPDRNRQFQAFASTGSWAENSVTWNNQPGYGPG